jgi:hypothetical protein
LAFNHWWFLFKTNFYLIFLYLILLDFGYFQLLLWMSRNKLIHEDLQLVPATAFKQISKSMAIHLTAWHASSLPSLWLPP